MNRQRKAFTLIELLVVISIIALLLSIMMPSLGKIKEKAKNLICSTNMKSLVLVWTLYANDNDDQMVSAMTYSHYWESWGGEKWDWVYPPFYLDGSEPIPWNHTNYNPTLDERKEGIKQGALYPYYEDPELLHCVSDKSLGNNYRSYSIPDCMGGNEGDGRYGGFWTMHRKVSNVTRAGEKYVFLEEADTRGFNMGPYCLDLDADRWWDPLTVWHAGASSFGFADGHAEQRLWHKETVDYFLFEFVDNFGLIPLTDGGWEDLRWMQDGWAE